MPEYSPIYAITILLADDDLDDCLLFKEAMEELPMTFTLKTVHNGEQLMQLLNQKNEPRPDILFLDLNMPRKNGILCLSEIKRSEELKQLPVVVYSTSFQPDVVNQVYECGAQHYIRKPNEFPLLKKLIYQAITKTVKAGFLQPAKEEFVLSQ